MLSEHKQTTSATVRPVSVLVVEDEAIVARDLERSLGDLGYAVIGSVSTGASALGVARQYRPDVTLMDVRLHGDLDGIDTGRVFRTELGLPVVYLTAYADRETLARAGATQPYGYVVKPYTHADVRAAIEIAHHKHRVECEFSRRERWFSTIVECVEEAVIACDLDGNVSLMNPAAERLVGLSESESRGQSLTSVLSLVRDGAERLDFSSIVSRSLTRQCALSAGRTLTVGSRGSEPTRLVESSVAPIAYEGEVLGAVIILRDVSERVQTRRRLEIAERMTALGTLADGVAHEINNPLTYVLMNLEFVARMLEAGPESMDERAAGRVDRARRAIGTALEGTGRIRRIVADMGVLGQSTEGPQELVDVRECVQWALRVTHNETRHRATVKADLQAVPRVLATRTHIGQVLVNLIVNAVDALGSRPSDANEIRVETRTDERGFAVIAVQDNGEGVGRELSSRIFEPFFSTKQPGEGTGLGLSVCHGILQRLGGSIDVESTEGQGARFEVTLPPADAHREAIVEDAAGSRRRLRVLVVDDEPNVLEALRRGLEKDHDVTAVPRAEDVVSALAAGESFDVLLCDLMMPKVSGAELHAIVLGRWPAVADRMVFMTGGAFTKDTREFLGRIENRCLTKPFTPEDVHSVLVQVGGASWVG